MSNTETPVAHACNTSDSGGRDQGESQFKSAQANSLSYPISQKKAGGVTQGIGPEFKPQYRKKKKKKKPKTKRVIGVA
jgi:hypothetical protein